MFLTTTTEPSTWLANLVRRSMWYAGVSVNPIYWSLLFMRFTHAQTYCKIVITIWVRCGGCHGEADWQFLSNAFRWPRSSIAKAMSLIVPQCFPQRKTIQEIIVLNMLPPTRTFVHLPIMSPIMTPSIMGYKFATPSEQYVNMLNGLFTSKRPAAGKRQGCSNHVSHAHHFFIPNLFPCSPIWFRTK